MTYPLSSSVLCLAADEPQVAVKDGCIIVDGYDRAGATGLDQHVGHRGDHSVARLDQSVVECMVLADRLSEVPRVGHGVPHDDPDHVIDRRSVEPEWALLTEHTLLIERQ